MLKQHPEDQEKYPNTDEPNKDWVAAKLKTIRTGYRKACDIGVVVEELSLPFTEKFLGGSPAGSPPVFLMLLKILYKISFRQRISSIQFQIIYLL